MDQIWLSHIKSSGSSRRTLRLCSFNILWVGNPKLVGHFNGPENCYTLEAFHKLLQFAASCFYINILQSKTSKHNKTQMVKRLTHVFEGAVLAHKTPAPLTTSNLQIHFTDYYSYHYVWWRNNCITFGFSKFEANLKLLQNSLKYPIHVQW